MSKQVSGKSIKHYVLVPVLSIVLLAGLALWVFSSSGRSGKFEADLVKQYLMFEISPSHESHIAALEALMENPNLKEEVQMLLASKYHYHSMTPDDPSLVIALKKIPEDSELAREMRNFFSEQKGVFDPGYHSFRDIMDAGIVDDIDQLGHNHETVKRLREAAYGNPKSALFPTAVSADFVRINHLDNQVVGVCVGSKYKGEPIYIFYNNESHPVKVVGLNCAKTEADGILLVNQQEVLAEIDSFFIGKETAEKVFTGNDSAFIKANILQTRYMTQPVKPVSSVKIANASVE